ncbi:MAG: TctA family transporter [Natronomonas sp.]|jgi:TctA family transporter
MNRSNIAGVLFAFSGVVGFVHFVVTQGTLLSNAFTGLIGVSFLLVGRLMWLRDD